MSERVEVLEIDLTDIQTEAAKTGKTLKELRQEVKDLRTQLENTEIGTEEFGKALDDLTVKQQELTNVTKSGIAAQKGSYNDLVNQMALLKKEWRATADEAERSALGEQINEINTKLKELDATTGNHQREVGNYRQALKGLKEELLMLEEGTEEYNQKLAQAAEISQKMQDVNEFVAASAQDLGDHISNVSGAAAGMVGAFQTVQATLNLVGVESESVGKMIATMQNLMAITQGLKAIEGAVDPIKRLGVAIKGTTLYEKLFKTEVAATTVAQGANTVATKAATVATNTFKKALISTGIGAIVVALGLLIANLDKVKKLFSNISPEKKAREALIAYNTEISKMANEASAEKIVRVKELAMAYSELGDNLDAKKGFVEKYREELENMGIEMNNVNDADDIFIEKTPKYIEALMNRAKAEAIKQKATEDYKKGLDIISEAAEKAAKGTQNIINGTTGQSLLGSLAAIFGVYQVKNAADDISEAQKLLNENFENAFKMAAEYEDKAAQVLGNPGDAAAKRKAAEEAKKKAEEAKKKAAEEAKKKAEEAKKAEQDEKNRIAKYRKAQEDFAKEQLRIDKDLADTAFKAKQTTISDQYERELKELEENKRKELAVLDEYNRTVLEQDAESGEWRRVVKNEQDIKEGEQRLLTTKKYEEARLNLEKIYAEKEAAIRKKQVEETEKETITRIEAINKKMERSIDLARNQYEIASQADSFTGNAVSAAKSLERLLSAERDALTTQKDELLAIRQELEAAGEDLSYIDAEIAKTTHSISINSMKLQETASAVTAAKLEEIGGLFDAVKGSLDQLLALDLGVKWGKEFGMAFEGIQQGLAKTSAALKSGEKNWAAYGQMAAAGLSAAANILTSLADQQDEQTEDGFEKQKKLQIAAATMSMLGGVISAVTSAFNPANAWMTVWGQAAAAATMSALVIATGAMQIANIKKQTLDSAGKDSSASAAVPTLSALQMMDTGVQATTTIEGASAESTVTDTRVYVVETDITNTQNNVKSTVAEATF